MLVSGISGLAVADVQPELEEVLQVGSADRGADCVGGNVRSKGVGDVLGLLGQIHGELVQANLNAVSSLVQSTNGVGAFQTCQRDSDLHALTAVCAATEGCINNVLSGREGKCVVILRKDFFEMLL